MYVELRVEETQEEYKPEAEKNRLTLPAGLCSTRGAMESVAGHVVGAVARAGASEGGTQCECCECDKHVEYVKHSEHDKHDKHREERGVRHRFGGGGEEAAREGPESRRGACEEV